MRLPVVRKVLTASTSLQRKEFHSEMREKEFPTRWEAEKFCEEWRKEHWYFGGAAWAESITEPRPITANDVLAAAVIKKILRY